MRKSLPLALRVIEREASMTLAEMRSMVAVLRRDRDTPGLLAPHGLADIGALAAPGGPPNGPVIEVEQRGALESLSESVQAMLYRVARESVTNDQRHARRPQLIHVLVEGSGHGVRLIVTDDGERVHPAPPA